jgi:hypothetical protein
MSSTVVDLVFWCGEVDEAQKCGPQVDWNIGAMGHQSFTVIYLKSKKGMFGVSQEHVR